MENSIVALGYKPELDYEYCHSAVYLVDQVYNTKICKLIGYISDVDKNNKIALVKLLDFVNLHVPENKQLKLKYYYLDKGNGFKIGAIIADFVFKQKDNKKGE